MTNAVSQTLPLDLLEAGERGVIVSIDGRSEVVVRLEEMGLHAGVRVQMIRTGSPCIVEVNHHRLLLRLEETTTVLVSVVP